MTKAIKVREEAYLLAKFRTRLRLAQPPGGVTFRLTESLQKKIIEHGLLGEAPGETIRRLLDSPLEEEFIEELRGSLLAQGIRSGDALKEIVGFLKDGKYGLVDYAD